jgi:hypothetical protein
MPWTNSAKQSMLPAQTLMTDTHGRHTKDARFFSLAMFRRTGGGTGIVPQVSPSLAATGTPADNEQALLHDWNVFDTVAAGAARKLPVLLPGQDVQVFNNGANAITLNPQGQAIDGGAVNAPYVLAPGKTRIFQATAMNVLYSTGN